MIYILHSDTSFSHIHTHTHTHAHIILQMAYIVGSKHVNLANDTFGFNGWSHSVAHMNIVYIEEVNGRFFVGIRALVRVQLKDGVCHKDVGYGRADEMKFKAQAIAKARKEAVTDGLKRALK